MKTLTLSSVEQCITAAYHQYLTGKPGTITCTTIEDGTVNIQCVISGTRFNCGFAGYQMNGDDTDHLRTWCITHPGDGWSFGFRGISPSHPDSLNITLIDKTPLMFNFHVYLG
ncbi:hypothetical protein SAMN02927921_02819 [Sinomicrobium oceani]|uniref:Uncharacterized protein n=1 Tax=Sinomicrobium oceani TaxID=1150368 RepID=A0A1K1QSB0_9FLAO|nr:hypothetical protein [Sinomicrobium oceani]SFW62807.1 hypothetical protein SAMN02927921_02819 [Sinomicrobium oceani]